MNASFKQTLVGFIGLAALAACDSSGNSAPVKDTTPTAAAASSVAPVVVKEDPYKQIDKLTNASAAIAFASPQMEDTVQTIDEGTKLLANWASNHMEWSDVSVSKNETSLAATKKDSEEARGKRLCVSGTVIQIQVNKLKTGKIFDGILMDYNGGLYRFGNAGSSGELVGQSHARMCGIVTGNFDYPNSAGGTGHAIKVIGMFDLPANRGLVAQQ